MQTCRCSAIWDHEQLPNANAAMLNRADAGAAKAAVKRPLVAVVDDDPAICGSLKFSLELDGFAVCTYPSGAALLHSRELDFCDCFVIDQRMPGMTGMELVDALRRRRLSTPVILIVSQPNGVLSAQAAKLAVPIVEKPLFGDALVERIREACGLA
jgi:two-component system, LuxR family, response regulator FixJ